MGTHLLLSLTHLIKCGNTVKASLHLLVWGTCKATITTVKSARQMKALDWSGCLIEITAFQQGGALSVLGGGGGGDRGSGEYCGP
jgi:hypothetical protein